MRLPDIFCLLVPVGAHATCQGRDLRLNLTPESQAELDRAIGKVPFPEENHWIASKGDTDLHLIGTLHTNDARMGTVIDRLAPSLNNADAFYFEVT